MQKLKQNPLQNIVEPLPNKIFRNYMQIIIANHSCNFYRALSRFSNISTVHCLDYFEQSLHGSHHCKAEF